MNDMPKTAKNDAARKITIAAIVSAFIYSFVMTLPSTVINEVIDEFSLTGAGEGFMISIINVGFLASLFVVPLFQGRVRKITMIIAACVLQAMMLLMIGAAPGLLFFSVACVFLGISEGFVDTCSNSIIVDVWKDRSAKYLGYLHGLYGVGSLIAPLLIYRLMSSVHWRGVHYIIATASAATALFIFIFVRNRKGAEVRTVIAERKMTKSDIAAFFKSRRSIVLSIAGFMAAMAQGGVVMWIVRYMTLRFDAAQLGALAMSAYWLCATVNRLLLAQIMKREPMKFFALGALLFGIILAIGVFSGNAVVLCVAVGAAGFCGGLFIPVLVSEFAVGYEGRTSFTTSMAMFFTGVPRIAAPVLVALASTAVSLIFGMMIPVVSAIAAAVCGLLAYRFSKA